MRILLTQVLFLIRKEFLSTVKDPRTKTILVVPVVMQSLLFGYAATFNLERVPYALLDLSRSAASTDFVAKLEGGGIFRRMRTLSGANEIPAAIDSGDAILVVTIAQDFERELMQNRAGRIQVITDGRNTMTASIASGYVGRIVDAFNGAGAVELSVIEWYNPNGITRWDFLPGLMGLLSLIQVMLLAGLSVAREREQGTFDQLLVTPLAPWQILVGKMVVPVVIGVLQALAVFVVCRFFFEIPFAGTLPPLILTLFVFAVSCTGIGLSISAVSSSMQQVMVYCFVLLLPMALLSGFATPVANMPEALQVATYANPLRFAINSLRRIYLEGVGFTDVALNFVPMIVVAAVTLPLAAWLFRNKLS